MEVRAAYCEDDFEWEMTRKMALQGLQEDNVSLLRKKAEEAFSQKSSDKSL